MFLCFGVKDSYVWGLVFLRLSVSNFLCLGVSLLTVGVKDSYFCGLVFLRLGVSNYV